MDESVLADEHTKEKLLMTFRYFAYGSNMPSARRINRCACKKLIGTGVALNLGLGFSKSGKDGSGKAVLVRRGYHDDTAMLTFFSRSVLRYIR